MTDLAWVNRYTVPETPMGLAHLGWGCRVVTDARCILSVADPSAPFEEPQVFFGDPEKPESFEVAKRKNTVIWSLIQERVPPDAGQTTLNDLWLWLDRIERRACAWCSGTGDGTFLTNGGEVLVTSAGVACGECEGKGWYFPEPYPQLDADPVTVCGYPLDRNRLSWWLAGELQEHGTEVRFWATSAAPAAVAVVFDNPQWRLVCSSKHRDAHPARYRTYLPGCGQWWQHRYDPVARMAATDWAMERGADYYDLFGEHQ
jgi:hypothetical protein